MALQVRNGRSAATSDQGNSNCLCRNSQARSLGGGVASSLRSRAAVRPFTAARCQVVVHAEAAEAPRLRLNNLGPEKGSRRPEQRKGRGYGAGQVRGSEHAARSCRLPTTL